MLNSRRRVARGVSLIELIIVVAVIAIMLALLLPAVQKVRESAAQTDCRNRLRNFGFACHTCHDNYKLLPPMYGSFRVTNKTGTVFFHLLPFMDQGGTYEAALTDPTAFIYPLKIYTCTSDPSSRGRSPTRTPSKSSKRRST